MTVFDVRDLAATIGKSCNAMAPQDAEELVIGIWRFLHSKRPDLTLARWRAMVEAAQNVEHVPTAEARKLTGSRSE